MKAILPPSPNLIFSVDIREKIYLGNRGWQLKIYGGILDNELTEKTYDKRVKLSKTVILWQ